MEEVGQKVRRLKRTQDDFNEAEEDQSWELLHLSSKKVIMLQRLG